MIDRQAERVLQELVVREAFLAEAFGRFPNIDRRHPTARPDAKDICSPSIPQVWVIAEELSSLFLSEHAQVPVELYLIRSKDLEGHFLRYRCPPFHIGGR